MAATEGGPAQLDRDLLFVALTRPQMFAGVTYSFFVLELVLAAELFLLFKSAWVLPGVLLVHGAGALACLAEPRIFDLWLVKASRCPRVPNHRAWGCNSYRP